MVDGLSEPFVPTVDFLRKEGMLVYVSSTGNSNS